MHTRSGPHIRLMAYDSNSALPAGPISWGFYSGGRDRRTFRNIHQEDTRWMCSCERVTENASNLWASSKHPRHPFLDWFGIDRHMLSNEEIFCALLTLQCPSHSLHFLDTILDIIPVVHVFFLLALYHGPHRPFTHATSRPSPFCVTYEALYTSCVLEPGFIRPPLP